MKTKWNVTKLIAVGSLAVLLVVLELGGGAIAGVTGIPGTSGFFNAIVEEMLVVICLFVIDEFGAATLMRLILGILVLPLPIIGTPGFLPKIAIAGVIGLISDVLYLPLKRYKWVAACVIGAVSEIYYAPAIVAIGRLVGMPGVEEMAQLMLSPLILVGALVIGAISGLLGWVIYSRIRDTAAVIRIRGE